MAIGDRLKKAWNAFRGNNYDDYGEIGPSSHSRQDRTVLRYSNDKTTLDAIMTRISIDVASVEFRHVKFDSEGRYSEDVNSNLNKCFTLEANLDQGPNAFIQDVVLTMLDDGVAAVVPVDAIKSDESGELMDIFTLRVGQIVKWFPRHITTHLYNIEEGERRDVTLEKRKVAIVDSPLYNVMNKPNSTHQRLLRKLALLDGVDEASASGKLDIIIQLPYAIKSEAQKTRAENRREDLEFQLKGSKYGIAYTDGTEKITQLNRPAENNLLKQIEYLYGMLYGQLGLTEEVMNGTADEPTMLNYFSRTIEPIIKAIVQATSRSLISSTAYDRGERVSYFQNPFKLVPAKDLAEIIDKFKRNEVLTGNECRVLLGFKPSKDPKADELINSNMPQPEEGQQPTEEETEPSSLERNGQNGA